MNVKYYKDYISFIQAALKESSEIKLSDKNIYFTRKDNSIHVYTK